MFAIATRRLITPNLSLTLRVKGLEERLVVTHRSVICAFSQILDLKDINTGVHSTRLAEWAVRVACNIGVAEGDLPDIETAALLHDIGKVGIPDAILHKPGRLTEEENSLMKKHPEYGWAILRLFPELERASLFVLHHHESFDGAGYPAGLKGAEIPIGARIVAVIDAFDAMVTSRPYRARMPVEEALRRLILASRTQFDPVVVEAFVQIAQTEGPAVFAATRTSTSVALR